MRKRFTIFCALFLFGFGAFAKPHFVLSCSPTNDLYRVLKQSGIGCQRLDSPEAAVKKAANGSAVLILAEGYPKHRTAISNETLKQATAKRLNLYVEFADALPGVKVVSNEVRGVTWERGVVAANVFGNALPPLSILALHDCRFIVGSSRVDLQACKLEYSIVSPK